MSRLLGDEKSPSRRLYKLDLSSLRRIRHAGLHSSLTFSRWCRRLHSVKRFKFFLPAHLTILFPGKETQLSDHDLNKVIKAHLDGKDNRVVSRAERRGQSHITPLPLHFLFQICYKSKTMVKKRQSLRFTVSCE